MENRWKLSTETAMLMRKCRNIKVESVKQNKCYKTCKDFKNINLGGRGKI